jgi:HK97 family phage prohead protease
MVDTTLDTLRKDALSRRIKGVDGGLRVHWNSKQCADLRDWMMALSEDIFRASPPLRKFADSAHDLAGIRAKLMASSALAAGDSQPGSNPPHIFCITSPNVDLEGDSVKPDGLQFDQKNFPVLFSHDSASLPIGRSSMPWRVDQSTLASVNWPAPGISSQSDQISAMVRAGQVKGASIGFIPIKYAISKDPSRPFGIDFIEARVIEWSICAIPCNQSCLAIGPANNKSASNIDVRRREARALAASARSIGKSIQSDPIPTLEQRLAEARNFKRVAAMAGRS